MFYYIYDEETKIYKGSVVGFIDPLESQKQGMKIYLVPANSTIKEPPACGEKEVLIYSKENDSWEIVENHVGETYYNKKTGDPLTIVELGPIPSGFVEEPPVFLKDEKQAKIEQVKLNLGIAQSKNITFKDFTENVYFRVRARNILEGMGEDDYEVFLDSKNNARKVSYNELKEAFRFYSYFDRLSIIKASKLIQSISKCKSISSLNKIDINFDVTEEAKKLLEMSEEEVEKYFKNNTVGG